MRVKFRREPKSEHSFDAEKDFDGFVGAVKYDEKQSGLQMSFETNPGRQGSYFSGHIPPEHFDDLAREMLKVNQQFAIRAFGAAMQEFGTEKAIDSDAA